MNKFKAVEEAVAHLKLENSDIVSDFFQREIERCNNAIEDANSDMDILKNNHKRNIRIINRDIADIKRELNIAWKTIDVEAIKTNKGIDEYSNIFFSNIERIEENLKYKENQLEEAKEIHAEAISLIEDNIKYANNRIATIKG